VTGAELVRWSRLHERRSNTARWTPLLVLVLGAALAAWVYARSTTLTSASHAWLAGTVAAFGVAFLRVPFLVYWRPDAPLLAQLPIEGRALFDAALARCIRAAVTVTAIALLGAIPLALLDPLALARHAALAAALAAAAALLMPAVAVYAASLVDRNILTAVTALGGAPVADQPASTAAPTGQSSALLGALPGFVGTIVIVDVLLCAKWLAGDPTFRFPIVALLGGLAGASGLAILAVRATVAHRMGTILRDVSALDRQRLATLEIRPPTGIERAIGKLAGAGALAYAKDARLVRRRYPMAFALGAMIFLVLAIVGLSRPLDPTPWLIVAFASAATYAVILAGRLRRPPIELPRLTPTLPITPEAIRRAKHAWLAGWLVIFVVIPGIFAVLRVTI